MNGEELDFLLSCLKLYLHDVPPARAIEWALETYANVYLDVPIPHWDVYDLSDMD